MVHPANISKVSETGMRLRLKLSRIFHHDKKDIGFFRELSFILGKMGNNQGISCQSPLIQRARRFTSAQ